MDVKFAFFRRYGVATLTAIGLLVCAGCGESREEQPKPTNTNTHISTARSLVTPQYLPMFDEAAHEFDVPEIVLIAVGYLESHWQHYTSTEVNPNETYGIMGLNALPKGDSPLEMAAKLISVPIDSLKLNPRTNIRGATALLDEEFVKIHGTSNRDSLMAVTENWRPVLNRYKRFFSEEVSSFYYKRFQVFIDRYPLEATDGSGRLEGIHREKD
jgi:hypothetical protein